MSGPTAESVRAEVRDWLARSWDPDRSLAEWRELLVDSGWGCPTWPTEWYGRGLPVALEDAVHDEFRRAGAVGLPAGPGPSLAGVTLLEHGSDELKRRLLRPLLTGEDTWCQLFSEPGSGSDLAGLTTRADPDPDGSGDWTINGQKVWNTSAHHAKYGMLLARTNWDVPKHAGITYFAFAMHQPGVVVRPLKQMNGYASFNEVFINDARASSRDVIGEVGQGWTVALATLAHERRLATAMARAPRGGQGRVLEEYRAEQAELMEPYKWYPQRAGRVDLALERARAAGRSRDPSLRQELAALYALVRASEWTAQRAKAARVLGRPPGPEGSIGKLCSSHVARAAARVHTRLARSDALLAGSDGPEDGIVAEILLSVPGQSIAGGTDEIQRNIISERVLGMPKEPRFDTGPFRDVPKNLAT